MTNKNIQMKKREGNEWDNLFPITLTENVFDDVGVSLKEIISLFNVDIERIDEYTLNDKTIENITNFMYILENKKQVVLTGLFKQDDFPTPTMFVIENISGEETWVEIDGLTIDKELYIKVGNYKLKPKEKNILGYVYGLNKIDSTREDSPLVQLIFDHALVEKKTIDFTGCYMNINNTVYLDKPQHPRKRQIVIGGHIKNTQGGIMFDRHEDEMDGSGGYFFKDLIIESVEGNGLIVFTSKMVRMEFRNPEFYSCDTIWYGEKAEHHLQTIYVHNAYIVGGDGHVFKSINAYDIEFSGLVEHRMHYMEIRTPHNVNTHNAVIEGLDGYVYRGTLGRSLSFRDCYFEHNSRLDDSPYFKFDGYGGSQYNVTFDNNLIQGTPEQVANGYFYMVEFMNEPNSLSFKGNWSDSNLVDIPNQKDYKTKTVRTILNGNHVDGNKNILRINGDTWKTGDIEEGSGELWGLHANVDASVFSNVGIGNGSVNTSGVLINKTGGTDGGIQSTKTLSFVAYQDYVIGFKYTSQSTFTDLNIRFTVTDANDTNIKTYTLPLSKNNGSSTTYITLPPFTPTVNGAGRLRIALNGSTENGTILMRDLSVQRGTIANPYTRS